MTFTLHPRHHYKRFMVCPLGYPVYVKGVQIPIFFLFCIVSYSDSIQVNAEQKNVDIW